MTKTFSGVAVIAIAVFIFFVGWAMLPKQPISLPDKTNMETYETTMDDLVTWVGANEVNIIVHNDPTLYNVDVKVNSNHAWRHEGATKALKCLTQNGTYKILSEKETRNLHFLCIDPKTGEGFVAIVAKILRYKGDLRNATTFLYTAFQLVDETVDQYIKYETEFKSIVVNLKFSPGELFFTP